MNLSLGGLASGLDTAAIIDQLMQIERQPRVRMALAESVEHARQDNLRAIGTQLRSLLGAAKDLSSPGVWADTQTVDVSDGIKLAARRTGATAIGGHVVNVTALARAEQRSYTFTQGAGTLDVGGEQFTLSATDDGAAVAGAMLWRCGDRAVYQTAATNDAGRRSYAAYALLWECIIEAKREGRRVFDMGGIPVDLERKDDPMYGPYLFKKGFGGTPRRFVGAHDAVPSELAYRAYAVAEPAYTTALRLLGRVRA